MKIFKKEPFFMGKDNRDQLVKITKVLGTEDLYKYLKKYNLKLDDDFYNLLERCPRRPWAKLIKPECAALCSDQALDLLDKMLVYDQVYRY
jgi:casein kinase II subunit alpha